MNIETTPEFKTEKQLLLQHKNKQYYSQNKEDLQQKYKAKIQCQLCDRFFFKGSLNTHYKGYLCKKGQELKKQSLNINTIIDKRDNNQGEKRKLKQQLLNINTII